MCKRIIALISLAATLAAQSPLLINGRNPVDVKLRGTRFQPLVYLEMTPAQKKVVEHILAGERNGTLGGPFNILLRSPEMGDLAQEFGEYARYKTGMTNKQLELAIIMTARAWTAQYEWTSHKRAALQAGLSPGIVDLIAAGKRPGSMTPDEEVVYDVTRELLYARAVSDSSFTAAMRELGDKRLVNLVTVVTYYELVSMLMNMDWYPMQEGISPELKPIDWVDSRIQIAPPVAPVFKAIAESEGPSYGQTPITSGRFQPLKWAGMTPEQKSLTEQLLASERKAVTGNYIALLRSPELGLRLEKFGSALRFRGEIPDKLRQIAVLMIARHWSTQFEWMANHRAALRAGLSEEVIAAIAAGKRPAAMQANEEAAFTLLDELLRRRQVSDSAFKTAVDRLGERGVVNIVTLTGFWGMVSALMNLDLYPLPEGIQPELKPLP